MNRKMLAAGLVCALALGACERGKPRHLPPDPFAAPPPVEEADAPTAGMSAGLTKRSEMAGFFLDHIGKVADPLNRPPVVTPADAPILLDGFAFDPVAKTPAKGVDMIIDGKPYGARYGHGRRDVAVFFKTPALEAVGFRTTLPAGSLAAGPHTALVRVVAADGKSYFDSPRVAFEVR